MLHSQAKTKNQRAIQTIRDNTSVIDRFELHPFSDTVEVRRMLSRTQKDSQHFIVTLKSDVKRAAETTVVKPFAEIAIRGDKLRFTVKPKNQYPNLHINDDILFMIEKSIAKFMASNFSSQIYFSDFNIQGRKREWHPL
ncbi:hypothetical protein AB6D30_17420 [Pectobacterium brasiliense]|uniref:hypothetical protein n=1 Tax=Pectobacterium TaxID=122277 RepID=UPI00057F3E54|nr:hypothetical protein [Pectobacterium brasiliense]APS32147.1 hypothetical protein NC16_01240 [Pectobacterium brasiliense]KHT00146.1 hypothetical protein RC91_17230 [Pectobacterium brasiliense]MBA0196072.1 hypothetical protein [Pectobacterium brasiliense]MBN3094440.1 hypothetical protein [Pectobacterium brasiliense]MBN3096175.1 hypothetical protein [Pectobacterium brasiliense]